MDRDCSYAGAVPMDMEFKGSLQHLERLKRDQNQNSQDVYLLKDVRSGELGCLYHSGG